VKVDAVAGLSIEAVGDAAADNKVASKTLELPKLRDSADTAGGRAGNAADWNHAYRWLSVAYPSRAEM